MLSSIHPLGERARNNRWWVTASAFSVGAVLSGAAVGAAFGTIGSLAFAGVSQRLALQVTGAVAVLAALLDVFRIAPPGPTRQVNETWIGAYRGWVYGGAFGLQLGTGLLTYIVTWGVFAMFIAEMLAAAPLAASLVGAVFGLGRSATVLMAGFVDRPSRLQSFNKALADLGPRVRVGSSFVILGMTFLIGGIS